MGDKVTDSHRPAETETEGEEAAEEKRCGGVRGRTSTVRT